VASGDVSDGDGERVDHAQLSWPPGGGVVVGPVRDDGSRPVPPGSFGTYRGEPRKS
jgi:hypothetical protein